MAPEPWNSGLSDEQAIAASHFGSHARLLAGPGTGKTHTLANRIVFLVTEKNVAPERIFALTFTRVATSDLQSKIKTRLEGISVEMPSISTLHSFALRQLMRNADRIDSLPTPLRIADDFEEDNIIRPDLKTLVGCDAKDIKHYFGQLSADWESLNADEDDWIETVANPKFIGAWQEHRQIFGYTLRAELIYQLKKALEQIEDFELDPHLEHVLIDEFQDLNPCDLAIAKAISEKGAFLLVCGDDDQSIYGFRYADPSGIRSFPDLYQGAASLALTECRRCAPEILGAALFVAQQDVNRVEKELHSATGRPERGEVKLLRFQSQYSEAEAVAKVCRKLVNSSLAPREILILLRGDRNHIFFRPDP